MSHLLEIDPILTQFTHQRHGEMLYILECVYECAENILPEDIRQDLQLKYGPSNIEAQRLLNSPPHVLTKQMADYMNRIIDVGKEITSRVDTDCNQALSHLRVSQQQVDVFPNIPPVYELQPWIQTRLFAHITIIHNDLLKISTKSDLLEGCLLCITYLAHSYPFNSQANHYLRVVLNNFWICFRRFRTTENALNIRFNLLNSLARSVGINVVVQPQQDEQEFDQDPEDEPLFVDHPDFEPDLNRRGLGP